MPASRSSPPTRLILVRHGESVLGRAKRYAGHLDSPLSPRGLAQVRRLRRRFQKLGADIVISSDLRRCLMTAKILAPGVDILSSARLRELDFGDWDGRTCRSCRRRDPGRFDRWLKNPWAIRTPGGESLRQLWKRVRRYVDSLVLRHPGQTLALVTHAGPIRSLLAPDPSSFWTPHVPPAALFECDWGQERGSSTE
jgi:broad specificity phosphatase PhoE